MVDGESGFVVSESIRKYRLLGVSEEYEFGEAFSRYGRICVFSRNDRTMQDLVVVGRDGEHEEGEGDWK